MGTIRGLRAVMLMLLLGGLIRLWAALVSRFWYDEATFGLMGWHVLQGELPVFMYGQPFMGALEAYLLAPLFIAFGASVKVLETLPLLLSLGIVALVFLLGRRLCGARVALIAAAILAIPPAFILWWSHEARSHYPLTVVLGTVLLLLTLRVQSRPLPAGHWVLLGGLAGLVWWTNFLSLVYFITIGPALLAVAVRQRGWGRLAGAAGAFVLGSLPLWVYNLSHGYLFIHMGGLNDLATILGYLGDLVKNALPIILGIPPALRWNAVGIALALGVAAVYASGVVRLAREGGPERGLLLGLPIVTLVIVLITPYGSRLSDHDQKYLLPLYSSLPILGGVAIDALWRRRRALGWAALALVLGTHLTGVVPELYAVAAGGWRAHRAAEERDEALLEGLRARGLTRIYASAWARTLTFRSLETVIFSDPYQEVYPPYATAVDAAPRAAWLSLGRSPAFESTLRAMGVGWRTEAVGGLLFYTEFRREGPPLQEFLPDAGWRATASHYTETAAYALDRDAGTRWSSEQVQAPGMWYQLDLGRVATLTGLAWLPGGWQDVPAGFRVDLSTDGRTWETVSRVDPYGGPLAWGGTHPIQRVRRSRVEVRFPSIPARFLRLTLTHASDRFWWTIRELFVYAPAEVVEPELTTAELAAVLARRGVRVLYADHSPSARLALAVPGLHTLPANLLVDPYGWDQPDPNTLDRVRWRRGAAALVPSASAEAFEAQARAAGLGVTREALGNHILFTYAPPPPFPPLVPLPRAGLTVSASRHSEEAALAVDADPRTRWATHHPQTPGDWFAITLPAPTRLTGVRLSSAPTPHDFPRGLVVETSPDGARWERQAVALRTDGMLRWGGTHLLHDGVATLTLTLTFPPTEARALRLTLTAGDGVFDWSIYDLDLLAPAPDGR